MPGLGIDSAPPPRGPLVLRGDVQVLSGDNVATLSADAVARLAGAPGAQGPPGDSITGDPGDPGPPGQAGSSGTPGATGAQGQPGPPALDGDPGAQGDPGVPGLAGATGATGATGAQGIPGMPGLDAQDAPQGDPGVPGLQGTPGVDGAQGSQGIPGMPGFDGQDAQGEPGTPGLPGAQGTPGVDGAQGSPGVPGPPGIDGNDGSDFVVIINQVSTSTGTSGPSTLATATVNLGSTPLLTGTFQITGLSGLVASAPIVISIAVDPLDPTAAEEQIVISAIATDTSTITAYWQSVDGTPKSGPRLVQYITATPGLPGVQGIQGPPGLDAADGSDGTPGLPGQQGIQGIQGPTGADGPFGPLAMDGSDGDQGDPGIPGINGTNGTNGTNGSAGNPGPPGIDGNDGAEFMSVVIINPTSLIGLPAQAANTFLANATAGTAVPTAVASNNEGVMGRTSGNIQSIDSTVQSALIRGSGSVFWATAAAGQYLHRSAAGDLGFSSPDVTAPITFTSSTFGFDQTATLGNNARVAVAKNSAAATGTRRQINLIEGSNITITEADDSANERVNVTIAAAGSTLPSVATDTFLGNISGGTATAAAVAFTSIDSTSLIYDPVSHTFQTAAVTGAITIAQNATNSFFRSFSAKSVLCNAANSLAVPSDMPGIAALQYLRVNAANNALEWGTLTLASLPSQAPGTVLGTRGDLSATTPTAQLAVAPLQIDVTGLNIDLDLSRDFALNNGQLVWAKGSTSTFLNEDFLTCTTISSTGAVLRVGTLAVGTYVLLADTNWNLDTTVSSGSFAFAAGASAHPGNLTLVTGSTINSTIRIYKGAAVTSAVISAFDIESWSCVVTLPATTQQLVEIGFSGDLAVSDSDAVLFYVSETTTVAVWHVQTSKGGVVRDTATTVTQTTGATKLAGKFDGTSWTYFINGTLVDTASSATNIPTNLMNFGAFIRCNSAATRTMTLDSFVIQTGKLFR